MQAAQSPGGVGRVCVICTKVILGTAMILKYMIEAYDTHP